ncbi:hypothetical protein F0U59_31740 [Archangium gephyra]|nr:hypothetical protein F0U59_31740 [Archangium gephyra]
MSILAPAWAWLAGAIDGVGDTHLPAGIHVRCLPTPRLGVPATPLLLTRTVIKASIVEEVARSEGVTWVDSKGTTLSLPFTVTPDNPVYGYFTEPDVIWARLEVRETDKVGLSFEAIHDSEQGPTPFQTASKKPYALCHWFIPRVRVSGSGWVGDIRWLDATAISRYGDAAFWEWWSLPVDPAPRYTPLANAIPEAEQRVDRGAVTRQPMYVEFTASSPSLASPAGGADAKQRIDQVRPNLEEWLKTLLHDLSLPTWQLRDTRPMTSQGPGAQPGSMGVGIENFLLISSIDPDVGHYLGLGDVDRGVKAETGSLVLYRIRGLFRWNSAAWTVSEALSFLGGLRTGKKEAVSQFPELSKYDLEPSEDVPFLDLHQYAVAIVGQPPQGMSAPVLTSCDDRGWLSTPPPPTVRRAVRLVATGFQAPAVASVAAKDQYGERTLHAFPNGQRMVFGKPDLPKGLPLPWVVSQPEDPGQPGQARMEDRNAPDGDVDYRIAKGDWFGRWSDWGWRTSPAKARARPMRPALLLFAAPPQFAPPPADPPAGLLSGSIELRIPIPNIEELPAGGSELKELVLVETFGANPASTVSYELSNLPPKAKVELDPASEPGHPQHLLIIERVGPALYPAQQTQVVYTARWRDVLNQQSEEAYPAKKTIVDPRPPQAPVIIRPLDYTSRPDAMGHARVEFSFDGADGVGYRVYASTETTLLKALEGINGTLANDIRTLALINDRAGALVDHKGLFGWNHFELISEQPLYRDPVTHKVRFTHRVSAGLNVALFYRVVAEGPAGGLSELSKSSMFAFGVPNVGGPGQPLLSLVNVPGKNPVEHGVVLRVRVPHGASAPSAWRLRRTSTASADPLRMPTVLQGKLKPLPQAHVQNVASDEEGHSFELVATEGLKPWVNYRFVVEVQGDSPPGANPALVAGDWGDASGPVKLAVVPKGPPPPVQQVQISATGGGMQIVITPPATDSLQSTMMGNFAFEAWRIEKGSRPHKLDLPFAYDAATQTWKAFDAQAVPGGVLTSVSVRVIDPLGRIGEATLSNSI